MLPNMGSTQEVAVDYSSATAESITRRTADQHDPEDRRQPVLGDAVRDRRQLRRLQGSNTDADLVARGLATPNSLKQQSDINPGSRRAAEAGHALVLHLGAGSRTRQNYVGGLFQNKNAGDITKWTYVPDPAQQAVNAATENSVNLRLTWQATPKQQAELLLRPALALPVRR